MKMDCIYNRIFDLETYEITKFNAIIAQNKLKSKCIK